MNEDEWEALMALQVFESVTFPRVQRRLTLLADTARQARELIERQGRYFSLYDDWVEAVA